MGLARHPIKRARGAVSHIKIKHKILHVKRAWAELENSIEKQSARVSIDRTRQIYTVNPAEHSIPTLYTNTYFEQV